MADEILSSFTGGDTAAVNGGNGGQVAPITERTSPVAENLARAERVLAGAVVFDVPPLPVAVGTDLGAKRCEPATDDREWVTGDEGALSWLLGRRAVSAVRPPSWLAGAALGPEKAPS